MALILFASNANCSGDIYFFRVFIWRRCNLCMNGNLLLLHSFVGGADYLNVSRCLSIELEMSMWARRGRIAAVIPSPSGVDSWGMKPPTHNFFSRLLFRDCYCWHCTYGCVCTYVYMYTCVHMYCLLLLSYKGCWCNNAVALLSNLTNEPMGLSNSWQKYFFLLLFLNLVRSL